jgi:trans-aconitate 2-methyltransferase
MATAPQTRSSVSGTHWDPSQYAIFGDHRLRPALELLGRVSTQAPKVVYDLGCGPGNVTRIIAERWPDAKVIGVDNSPQMLEKAASEPSSVEWIEADVRTWTPETAPDVIYSNATLQWVDGHETIFPRLVSLLAPGGCLAAQMPLSRNATSHKLMVDVLREKQADGRPIGGDELIATMSRKWVLDTQEYYDLLVGATAALDIWHTEYLQVLSGEDAVLEWVTATGLRPVLNGLDGADRDEYVKRYRHQLNEAYPRRDDGHTLYPFRRLFMTAQV